MVSSARNFINRRKQILVIFGALHFVACVLNHVYKSIQNFLGILTFLHVSPFVVTLLNREHYEHIDEEANQEAFDQLAELYRKLTGRRPVAIPLRRR